MNAGYALRRPEGPQHGGVYEASLILLTVRQTDAVVTLLSP